LVAVVVAHGTQIEVVALEVLVVVHLSMVPPSRLFLVALELLVKDLGVEAHTLQVLVTAQVVVELTEKAETLQVELVELVDQEDHLIF
jgi:hypothetical protein